METTKSQKSKTDTDSNHDYISNLPSDLKQKILLILPIKEVARTSILSQKWNEFWTSIPDLVFEEPSSESTLIKMVDMVLLVHEGPIRRFKSVSLHPCDEAIDRWILILSRNGIRDLELRFDDENRSTIPSRLFSCLKLEDVNLSGCVIEVPPFFRGFKLVRTLSLSHFELWGMSIENLISKCPLLERLTLSYFLQEGCLRILAPNLEHLDIFGEFHDICLETPKLISASIYLKTSNGDIQNLSLASDREGSNITHAFGSLSNIRKLDICGEFIEYLSMGPIPENTPTIFRHLTELRVHICIPDPNEIATSLRLFQNAPNLEVLHIEFWESDPMDDPQVEDPWGLRARQYCVFKHLKIVNIMYTGNTNLSLRCTKFMIEFATLIVRRAHELEKINVIDLEEAKLFFKMLNCFPKLSKKAKIVFLKRCDEE